MRIPMECAWRLALVPLLLAALPAPAGVVVFSQPTINGAGGWGSDARINQYVADSFSLSGTNLTLTTVRWWGEYYDGTTPVDDFTVQFYQDAGGSPALTAFAQETPATVARTNTGWTSAYGHPIFEYEVDLATPLTVAAGTPYYLSVFNNTPGPQYWNWLIDHQPGTLWGRVGAGAWGTTGSNLAFELEAVPEPGSLALLGLGALALLRRRRR